MRQEIITYFPCKDSNLVGLPGVTKTIREQYTIEDGKLVGTYRSYFRNGNLNTEKTFDENGLVGMKRFRPDGTKISKMNRFEERVKVEKVASFTLTAEELKETISKYEEVRKTAIQILHSNGVEVSLRATDKSLLKQFKQFEENRFSF